MTLSTVPAEGAKQRKEGGEKEGNQSKAAALTHASLQCRNFFFCLLLCSLPTSSSASQAITTPLRSMRGKEAHPPKSSEEDAFLFLSSP
jgi:hypothetical protein